MKTLVTGGLGFVGSNLVDILVNQGDEVVVIDNLSSESSSYSYRNKDAEYFIMDINDILISKTLTDLRFDRIFHLAAEARIQPSFENPHDYLKSNIYGTGEICEYARIIGCKSLVYATTSSKNHGNPYLTPYTYTKVAGEGIVKTYSECFDMSMAICTFYNVYGPREPKNGEWATVVAKFIRQYNNGDPITIVGDGKQTRDFTHVEDICLGMIKVSQGKWRGDNFDLGKGHPISIYDLAMEICENVDDITFVPFRKNEGQDTLSNHEDTFNKIGWKAKHSLFEYIEINRNKYAQRR